MIDRFDDDLRPARGFLNGIILQPLVLGDHRLRVECARMNLAHFTGAQTVKPD